MRFIARIKDILKNGTSSSNGSSDNAVLSEEEKFAKEWINEDELLKTYGITVDGGKGRFSN